MEVESKVLPLPKLSYNTGPQLRITVEQSLVISLSRIIQTSESQDQGPPLQVLYWANQIPDIHHSVAGGRACILAAAICLEFSAHKHCFMLLCAWSHGAPHLFDRFVLPMVFADGCLKHNWICYVLWKLNLEQLQYPHSIAMVFPQQGCVLQ